MQLIMQNNHEVMQSKTDKVLSVSKIIITRPKQFYLYNYGYDYSKYLKLPLPSMMYVFTLF